MRVMFEAFKMKLSKSDNWERPGTNYIKLKNVETCVHKRNLSRLFFIGGISSLVSFSLILDKSF